MIYYLNQDTVPTIPTPHDCKIKKVTIRGDFIIFEFEDDISYHDSIRHFNPDAKSLVIKIHLVDDFDTYKMKYIPSRAAAHFPREAYFTHEVHFTNPVRDLFR